MPEYSAKMLDHFYAPRNGGALTDFDIIGRGSFDGDGRAPRTEIYLKLSGDIVERAGFTTFGCGAAIASGSALTEIIIGKTLPQCEEISVESLLAALDGLPPEKQFCANIAVDAVRDGMRQWRSRNSSH